MSRQESSTNEVCSQLGLPPEVLGVLPSQALVKAVDAGYIESGEFSKSPVTNIQPGSIDLRLGEVAYRIRCSFLPDGHQVETKLKDFVIDELSLTGDGAVLETNRPYLIPLAEELHLPSAVRGKTNPKSSTGRLDVFTRVITDESYRFDEIRPGYRGRLYLEVVPLSFTVRVKRGLALNQLRLSIGNSRLSDEGIHDLHRKRPLLYHAGRPVGAKDLATSDGLFLSLDLQGDATGRVGYRAKDYVLPLEMSRVDEYAWQDYWDPVYRDGGDRIVLAPGHFYLLLSNEAVEIPPEYAAEMTAYDPTSGELRTHYAGFFDPGFGFDTAGHFNGSRAALEVRAHDVPFMIEHGQRVCKLSFERMAARPELLYGESIGSTYQRQTDTLSKHFRRPIEPDPEPAASRGSQSSYTPGLFDELGPNARGNSR